MSSATSAQLARTCVVGLGQAMAGDDGVGPAVIGALQKRRLPDGCELLSLSNPMDLVALFESGCSVVLVDAVLASPPGRVIEVGIDELSLGALQLASSHGMGAIQAIRLAQALLPAMAPLPLRIVAITIEFPRRHHVGLSREVAAALPNAVETVLSLLRG
jgi:hydrogenase maturation protease